PRPPHLSIGNKLTHDLAPTSGWRAVVDGEVLSVERDAGLLRRAENRMLVGRRLALGIHRGREGEKQKGEGERKSSEREGFPQHGSAPERESYAIHENAKRVRLSKRY